MTEGWVGRCFKYEGCSKRDRQDILQAVMQINHTLRKRQQYEDPNWITVSGYTCDIILNIAKFSKRLKSYEDVSMALDYMETDTIPIPPEYRVFDCHKVLFPMVVYDRISLGVPSHYIQMDGNGGRPESNALCQMHFMHRAFEYLDMMRKRRSNCKRICIILLRIAPFQQKDLRRWWVKNMVWSTRENKIWE